MKTELKFEDGKVQLWHDGAQIGEVVGAEGAGVQVISKHPMLPQWHADETSTKWVEIRIASHPPSAQPFPPPRG